MAKASRLNRREFDDTWREYRRWNRRDLGTAINTKLFYIGRRSVVETPKAKIPRLSKALAATYGRIINHRRRARGEKGLQGQEMKAEVTRMHVGRRRSVAYLKSAWLPGIKEVEPFAEKKSQAARKDRSAAQVGRPKGGGKHAPRETVNPSGKIWNAIGERGKRSKAQNAALLRHGAPALQRAFDHETASMKDYIVRKQQQRAKSLRIRTR